MQTARKMIIETHRQPATEYMVELEFDLERALRYLGTKAVQNKSKRTKLGFIKVKVWPTQGPIELR